MVPSETVKSGRGLPVWAGCAPRLQAGNKRQRQQEKKSEETRKPHILIIRSERAGNERAGGAMEESMTKEPEYTQTAGGWKPVLGLSDEPGGGPRRGLARVGRQDAPGTVFDQPEPEELIELTVIVPARNEEDCLGAAFSRW